MTTLFLIVGLPGAGKTTAARRLATEHHAVRFTPDEWMMPLFGLDFDSAAWAGKRDVLEGRLVAVTRGLLDHGLDVVLDFGFWGREERDALRWLAARHGADARVVYLAVDPDTQWERVHRRWSDDPTRSFRMSRDHLDEWRAQFQQPDADELGGTAPIPEPDGGWSSWIATRWPSALD